MSGRGKKSCRLHGPADQEVARMPLLLPGGYCISIYVQGLAMLFQQKDQFVDPKS
jgi:hypothetical protein